jgi:hypothetical protein
MTDNVTPIESGKRKRRPKVGAPPVHGDWRDAFVYTREGEVAKVVSNAVAILSADERWAGVLAFDVFGGREILQKAPPWDPDTMPAVPPKAGDAWADADDVRATVYLQRTWSLHLSVELVSAAVRVVAQRHPVHPVLEYLDGLKWDGTRRLPREATGTVRFSGGVWSARVRLNAQQRKTFDLPTCATEDDAQERARVLARLAKRFQLANVLGGTPYRSSRWRRPRRTEGSARCCSSRRSSWVATLRRSTAQTRRRSRPWRRT